MTPKKHFKRIAQIMKEAEEDHRGGTPCELILSTIEEQIADAFVDICGKAWFDRADFLSRCQMDED